MDRAALRSDRGHGPRAGQIGPTRPGWPRSARWLCPVTRWSWPSRTSSSRNGSSSATLRPWSRPSGGSDRTHKAWLAQIRPVALSGDTLVLAVPDEFVKEWIEQRYAPTVVTALGRVRSDPQGLAGPDPPGGSVR